MNPASSDVQAAVPMDGGGSGDGGTGLFGEVLGRGPVRDAVGDRAVLQAMLDAEAALARANAAAGIVTAEHAEAVAAACDADRFDPAALGVAAAASGNPVVPLVRALSEAVGDEAAAAVHAGATSQDILDSAWMLVLRRALDVVRAELDRASDAAAGLAEAHRDTLMTGRTLLQQALPTTFGLKAAGWVAGLDAAAAGLERVASTRLAAQLGGAVGTLAALGDRGEEVAGHFASELGLPEPPLPWHTDRTRIADVAGALGTAAAVVGKVARDLVLLAQSEVAEVREGGAGDRGGSSTLPHKRNPVAAVSASACAAGVPGLVAALLTAAGAHEHERAAGAWHAEWAPLRDALRAVGSAASWLRDALEHLDVDAGRMRANLHRAGDLLLAERITGALAPALGRVGAHDLVRTAAREAVENRRSLAETLAEMPDVSAHLDRATRTALLDPAGYLGSAHAFIDRALRAHSERRS